MCFGVVGMGVDEVEEDDDVGDGENLIFVVEFG